MTEDLKTFTQFYSIKATNRTIYLINFLKKSSSLRVSICDFILVCWAIDDDSYNQKKVESITYQCPINLFKYMWNRELYEPEKILFLNLCQTWTFCTTWPNKAISLTEVNCICSQLLNMMKNPIAETVIGIPVSSVEGSSKGYFLLPEPAACQHHMHPPATESPTWKQSKNLSLSYKVRIYLSLNLIHTHRCFNNELLFMLQVQQIQWLIWCINLQRKQTI